MRRSLLALPLLALVACGSSSEEAVSTERTASPEVAATTTATPTTAEAPARTAQSGLRLVPVGRFDSPVYVTSPPGDQRRLFVVEQSGIIRLIRGGKRQRTPFLDIRRRITAGGEQGLLGLAFPRDYAKTGKFYVYYTAANGGANTLAEYRRVNADRANSGSGRVLFAQPDNEGNHNGGMITFGPDRFLYVGMGDGGGGNDPHGRRGNGQNLSTRLGKLLRLDPKPSGATPYSIPAGNPFAGRDGARPEIWSYGLRNPFRFSFDRRTGDLTIGDVGQNAIEEIDFVAGDDAGKGANFGWRPFEGNDKIFDDEEAPGHVRPVLTKTHDEGFCSITGGYVVRDPRLPSLAGQYVYGDFCDGRVRAAKLRTGGATGDKALSLPRVPSISSFGEDASARVYVVSLDGPVYRIAPR